MLAAPMHQLSHLHVGVVTPSEGVVLVPDCVATTCHGCIGIGRQNCLGAVCSAALPDGKR